ncbi:hypothetical protein F4821DRAFT_248830, partial [Hypoxylon rubiginosum]
MGDAPYPLFVLSDQVDVDYLNSVLQRTADSNDDCFALIPVSILDEKSPYACAPRKRWTDDPDPREIVSEGPKTPLPPSYVSSFVGKTLKDCASYLSNSPEDAAWSIDYFFALDEHCKNEDTILLARAFEDRNKGIHAFPAPTTQAVQKMFSVETSSDFEMKMEAYQNIIKEQGKVDRSIGTPWEFGDSDED